MLQKTFFYLSVKLYFHRRQALGLAINPTSVFTETRFTAKTEGMRRLKDSIF